jgi:hypothetical protein
VHDDGLYISTVLVGTDWVKILNATEVAALIADAISAIDLDLTDYRKAADQDIIDEAQDEEIENAVDQLTILKQTAVQYFDPDTGDYSIETDMSGGYTDFEFGLVMPSVPHSGLPAGTYNGDLMAVGGQIAFPTPDPDTADVNSTAYKFNHGDSNVTMQLLGWQSRPIYYNGQTLVRHWLGLFDDITYADGWNT